MTRAKRLEIEKLEIRLQIAVLGETCQRSNEDLDAFTDSLMEPVEIAYPEADYSFKAKLARNQFIQEVSVRDYGRENVFSESAGSLVEAVRVPVS